MSTELYAPYDSLKNPQDLGLQASTARTAFGSLFYVRSERTGPKVTVFLHGVGGTWATWTPLIQCARDRDVALGDMLLVDLPGFGASENIQNHLRADEVGDALREVVDDLGWSEIRLIGHSMGGFLALDIASRGSEEITSVGIVSGAYFSIVDTVKRPFRALISNRNTALAYLALVLVARSGPVGTSSIKLAEALGLMPLLLKRMVAEPSRLRPSLVRYLSRAVAPKSFLLAAQNGKHYDPDVQWGKITVPLRATFGATDHLVPPRDMPRLSAAIPGAIVTCIDHVGHFGHIERPDLVLDFLFRTD